MLTLAVALVLGILAGALGALPVALVVVIVAANRGPQSN